MSSSSDSGSDPHEVVALLCIVGWLMAEFAPRLTWPNALCNLSSLRARHTYAKDSNPKAVLQRFGVILHMLLDKGKRNTTTSVMSCRSPETKESHSIIRT